MTLMSTTRRGEQGYVLLFTAVIGLLAMGLWSLALRATHDTIRIERFVEHREPLFFDE